MLRLYSRFMASALRGSRLNSFAACVALLVAMSMSAPPLLHALGSDDACSANAGQHDPAAHSIGKGSVPANAPHCSVCHLWQSARFSGSTLHSTPVSIADFGLVAKLPVLAPGLTLTDNRPGRAPPAA